LEFNDIWNNAGGDYAGCMPGAGALSVAPMFINIDPRDYRLVFESRYIDDVTSNGAPFYDFFGNARFDDPSVEPNTGGGEIDYYDIGAPERVPISNGDFDKDGDIDGFDLAVLVSAFGANAKVVEFSYICDMYEDGMIDDQDLDIFAEAFGR